jgi:hypothetical protein
MLALIGRDADTVCMSIPARLTPTAGNKIPPPLFSTGADRAGGAFQRVTVNLTQKTSVALTQTVATSNDSQTDVINKALQVYALILEVQQAGGVLYLRERDGAELERIRLL